MRLPTPYGAVDGRAAYAMSTSRPELLRMTSRVTCIHFAPHPRQEAAMAVNPIPEGYHSITPYIIVEGAAQAIEFYKSVFGATETLRMPAPGGRIGHAEVRIGNSIVMLADANV